MTLHHPYKSFIQVLDMMFMISVIEIGEPFSLDQKPDAFNGVKFGRVRREIERFKISPVQLYIFLTLIF